MLHAMLILDSISPDILFWEDDVNETECSTHSGETFACSLEYLTHPNLLHSLSFGLLNILTQR